MVCTLGVFRGAIFLHEVLLELRHAWPACDRLLRVSQTHKSDQKAGRLRVSWAHCTRDWVYMIRNRASVAEYRLSVLQRSHEGR